MAVQKILSQQIANTGGTAGQVLVANSTGVTWGDANNALNLGGVAAASYQTTAGLSANVATLTANNTSYVGTVSAANVVSNNQLTANLVNYVNTAQLSSNLNNYQTTAGLSANVATLAANSANYIGLLPAANVISTTQLSGNLANYQTTAGLSTNVATLTANNASYLGGVAAASYVNTSSSYTITGVHTYNANIVIGTTAGISANGSYGTAGQVLTSNGTTAYWSTASSGGFTNGQSISVSNLAITGVVSANGSAGTAGYYLTSSGTSNTYWSAPPTTVRQQFTGDGTTTSFTVTGGYTANAISVFLNGVMLRNGTEVTVTSGTAVVFVSAPPSGALIDAIGNGSGGSSGGTGLVARSTVSATTASLANLATGNITATGYKSYALLKIQTSCEAWVRLYTDSASRTSDASRTIGTDPVPGSGVITEILTTTGYLTQLITPGIFGFNNDGTPSANIYMAVTNYNASTQAVTVTLTVVQMEL